MSTPAERAAIRPAVGQTEPSMGTSPADIQRGIGSPAGQELGVPAAANPAQAVVRYTPVDYSLGGSRAGSPDRGTTLPFEQRAPLGAPVSLPDAPSPVPQGGTAMTPDAPRKDAPLGDHSVIREGGAAVRVQAAFSEPDAEAVGQHQEQPGTTVYQEDSTTLSRALDLFLEEPGKVATVPGEGFTPLAPQTKETDVPVAVPDGEVTVTAAVSEDASAKAQPAKQGVVSGAAATIFSSHEADITDEKGTDGRDATHAGAQISVEVAGVAPVKATGGALTPPPILPGRTLDGEAGDGYMPDARFQQIRYEKMGYPDIPMPTQTERNWATPLPDYQPVEYTADSVKNAVPDWENPDLDAAYERAVRLSSFGRHIQRDPRSGRLLNPDGRTGITGHGRLRDEGPNFSADLYLTRGEGAETEVLLVERNTGLLAPTGGFRNELLNGTLEDGKFAAVREASEEMTVDASEWLDRAEVLSSGKADRSLSETDTSWVENEAVHIALTAEEGAGIVARPRDDAGKRSPGWVQLADIDVTQMGDHHAAHIRVLQRRARDAENKEQQTTGPLVIRGHHLRNLTFAVGGDPDELRDPPALYVKDMVKGDRIDGNTDTIGRSRGETAEYERTLTQIFEEFRDLPEDTSIKFIVDGKDGICNACVIGAHCVRKTGNPLNDLQDEMHLQAFTLAAQERGLGDQVVLVKETQGNTDEQISLLTTARVVKRVLREEQGERRLFDWVMDLQEGLKEKLESGGDLDARREVQHIADGLMRDVFKK